MIDFPVKEEEARETYESLLKVEHLVEGGITPRWVAMALRVLLVTIDELRGGVTYGLTDQDELDRVRSRKE